MAEQQLTQEQLGQEQQLDGLQEPVPKTNQTVTPAPAIVPQQPKFGDISAITEPIKPKKQQQVLPTKKAKKLEIGDLSGAEMAFEQHATFAKANKAGAAVTSSMIGSMTGPSTPFVYATQQEANAQMQQTKANEQKALIQKNSVINDLVKNKVPDKISDYLFGSFDDIIKFGGSVEKYIKKNTAGVEYIDEGLLRKDMDEAISAQGINAGRYLKTFLWSKVGDKQNLNTILSTFQGRDDIAKKITGGNTEAQQKAFLLSKQTDVKNRFKGQIETEERLLQEKVRKIQEKYSSAISDASVDANFYWAAAQDKAMKQLEGITGVYQPALQESFERRAKEIFDTEYAQFVSPKYDQIADSIAADIKIEVSKTNDAVKRINKEMDVAFKAEAETYLKGFNQAQIDQFTKDIGSIIDSKTKAREEQNKGYAQSLIDMSGMSGMVGTTAIGKILTETGMSALGSLKSKTALVLNALGLEADAIDAMKYSGKTAELNYSIEKLPLGQNWFKPGYWAQSIAQSGPSMAAGMLTTALTKNPYIGGIIAFGSESIENSGGVMERVLENTGDMEAARAAGQESFIKNFPTVLSEVLTQRMFAPLSALKSAKTPVGQRLNQLATGVASNALEEAWQTASELSSGADAKLGFTQAFFSKDAMNAAIEGGAVGGILGGASLGVSSSYKALFDKKNIPSVRTQSVAASIIKNGETAAMAGVQLDALANDMDEETLGEGMKEVQTVAKTIEEAKQIGLNPQQTQIFASLSQEVVELKNTLNNVTDPSARKAVEKQIAAKEKEIEGVVNGTTPLATIEIQPGVVFTSTPDGVKNVMNTPEVKEEVAAGNVKIYTDDAGLNAEVDKVKAEAPARQRNIISDTGEIIGQVPAEAAPVTETTPITQTQIPQDATQISERPQQEVGQPSDIVQRPRVEEGQPQERQAERPIGETAQPSQDTRNRDFGSQAQQAVQEITALPEQTPAIQNYTRTINPGQEVQLMDELAQQVTEGEDRAVRQLGQPVVDKVKQWIADTGYTAPAAPAAPVAEAAPVTEAAPVNVDELLTADTKEPTNLEKVFNFLDGIDKAIGKELNSGKLSDATRVIPLAAIQTMVKALKALVQGGMALQDAIRKVAADNNYTEKDVTDAMKKVAEIEKVGVMAGMTDEQIKEQQRQTRINQIYSNPRIQGAVTIANRVAESLKNTEKSSLVAYQKVFSTVQKAIQKMYEAGGVPEAASPQIMIELTKSIARDAVNAAYPSAKKMSAQEVEQVTMSTRKYIADLMRQQARAGAKIFENVKALRKAVNDIFKAMNAKLGKDLKYTDAEFRKIMKEMEDAVFAKPFSEENIDEVTANVTSIIEKAYNRKVADFEKGVRPKIKELLDRIMAAEMNRFGNVDEAAYSAFGKAIEYINANKREFGIKDIEPDNVLAQELDKKINELRGQERTAQTEAQVMGMFATPQVRSLVDAAQQMADDIVKANKDKKTGKTSPTEAYKNILSDLIKKINAMYARGNYPTGIASVTLVRAASGIAQDAVNASFSRTEKLSIQEAEMASMSTREYIRSIVSNQMNAIGKVKDRAKAIQAAISKVIDTLKTNFGTDFSLASSAIKALNKNLFDAVFSKMDDSTAIDEIIAKVTPVVEYAIRRQMLSNTAKLLDKIRSNYKLGRYSGAARLSIMENLLNADARKWLNSDATLEDISIFNQYLKELTGKNINTNNIDAAVALSNQFVPSPQQSTIAEKDSLNNKIKNLIKKVAAGQLDFKDYGMLVNLEKAINDINERKGALTGLTQQEQDEIIQNYNDLVASLPKPIDQLLDDAKTQIDADVKSKVDSLGTAIEASQEFRDSIKNPLLYEAVLRFKNEMTDDFINSLTPKEKMQLSANIDEILRGNPNSTTYEFSAKAGAFKKSNTNYKFGKDILAKRQVINNSGITGFFGKVRRLFMDIDFNRASAERMAASFDLFKFHMMDVELNTGVDEFGMGVLEREIFNPIARAIDSAFNKVTESLGAMQEAMKLLNDKSNKVAIKKGIGLLNKELGTGFFGGKAKWMHIKKLLGYGNSFYMDISTRMATIIATQIDHISNLEEGESPMDVVLLRNILEQKPDDYDGRTMKEHYETNPSAITDKTDDSSLFDHIAYGILTKGGVNKLSDLTKEQLLDLLTDSQRQAIAKWREHIDNTRNVVEAAMIMRGGVTAFLNEYFPRRVFSKEGVTEIKDIEEYLAQAGGNVGVDSGQLKSRRGEVGRLDLNGNSVLYNNLKDIYLIHEVKPVLDSLKGLDNAVERLKKERDLGAATYAEAVSIAVANRVKNSLESNERISNNNYSFWYKTASQVSSLASRVILISQLRQAFADFPSNVVKLSAALGFANRSMKNQVLKVVTPEMSSYTTDKGKFKWDDYVKIALTTGSSVHRIMSVYADNFLYEFSKPKEQLQREQRVASWQDMAVKKRAWMSRFEEAFNRITGEYLDHQAFADERSAYRAMYFDAVQKASDAADSLVDRQFGLASIARQPIRVNIAAPFVGRAIRNLFGKSPTIAKNNPASVILGFLTGYPTTQFQLFNRYMRSALSVDKDISAKQRTEDVSRALTEVIVPSVMYNVIRAATGTLFTTVAAAALVAGDDEEDRKRLYKEMESMPFWKRWFTKTRLVINEKQESFRNAVINGMLSSAVDPNVNAIVRPAAGFFLFKAWKENVIEDMTKSGKTKEEIQETRQKIKEYENTLFETYSIRPIELFGTKEYQEGIKRYYSAGAQSEGVEDLIKSTGGFGILYNEASRSMDLAKLIDSTDENKNLSETELYVASALKLGGITFSNIILGGKAGAALSMFSGDMNKVANMIISDQKSIQTGFEISQKKEGKKKNGGMRSGGLRSEGLGGGGLRSEGLR